MNMSTYAAQSNVVMPATERLRRESLTAPIKIGVIGCGKAGRFAHIPQIDASRHFLLAASASLENPYCHVPSFRTHTAMLDKTELHAVAICTPPSARFSIAADCIRHGLHVLLEKPPCTNLEQLDELSKLARTHQVTLFSTWHSRYQTALIQLAHQLQHERIVEMNINWHEDVNRWHPQQEWVWRPDGFGVFDSGINALSIATMLLSAPLSVLDSELLIPANAHAPIAAKVVLRAARTGALINASFDWRPCSTDSWRIDLRTNTGRQVLIDKGGAEVQINGVLLDSNGASEYARIYDRFYQLIQCSSSSVDFEPLRLTLSALERGRKAFAEA